MSTDRARQGLPDWLVIARREFIERVRTVWFLVVTVLGPIGMVAVILVPALLARSEKAVHIQVVDRTGKLAAPLVTELQKLAWKVEEVPADTPEATLLGRIADDEIDGFLTIPAKALGDGTVTYQGDNATSQMVAIFLHRTVTRVVQNARGTEAGLTDKQLATVLDDVGFAAIHTTGEAEGSSGAAVFLVGYGVMFILYMAIVLYGVNVMRSVVQEKTNRVVELMVAAAKPRALMLGKILGVGAVGLVQVGAWIGMAVVTLNYREHVLGFFGVADAGGWSIPPLSPLVVAVILTYFLLGYFFYASIYAAIGAMVSSDQDAQQAQTPVVLLLIIPMACITLVSNDPRGTSAEILTQIPFSSPILMPMRFLLGGASATSVAVSLGILAVSTFVVARLSARIYRVGILMTGKRPTLRELGRWMRRG